MNPKLFLPFLLLAFSFVCPFVHADSVPKLINYQGKLTDAEGTELNGVYALEFRLFDAADGGTLVWGEIRTVTVVKGVFNVALGGPGAQAVAGAAVNDIGFAFGDANRFLQTQILTGPGITAAQTLSPRQQMVSVPFALEASNSQHLGGREPGYWMPTGTVVAFAGEAPPDGWIFCDGREYPANDPALSKLASALGAVFLTGGGATFRVPDLRGRTVIGKDNMGGAAAARVTQGAVASSGIAGAVLGASGGAETHSLTIEQMPPHTHSYNDIYHSGNEGTVTVPNNRGSGHTDFGPDRRGHQISRTTGTTGGSGSPRTVRPHNNMQPSLVLKYIIKL